MDEPEKLRVSLRTAVPMESRISGFCSTLGILLLLGCFSSRTEGRFNPESFQHKLVALYKVLNYIQSKPQQMNVDVTFGITLTEANLAAALSHENAQHLGSRFFNVLKEITVLCNLTRRNLMGIVVPKNENELLLQSVLNNPDLWIRPITWRMIFSRARANSSRLLSYLEIIESIWYGTPNETESDQCLAKIARSSLNGECRIPASCIETLIRDDNSTGYPLTHRLLIVQVARMLECRETESVPFSYLIPEYCARILQDLANLEAWSFPSVAPDLMTEQVVLCGMEGYQEFVDRRYEDLILSWSYRSGCFNAFGFPEKRHITRRSSSAIDCGCDSHATALAAASLAVFIRENVENIR